MTKIQELLDNLLHKKLGRDVRQSIHDSIEQCYKDATGHPESVAGVIEENKNMQKQLDSNINTINGRIDTILTGTVNTTKLVTVHSATIRNNSASDLTFKISSKDNETLKSIKDKSPTVINANVIAKALDGVAINGKGIPSSYNVESTNDEYVITVYSGSSSVVGQYVFMAVVTIAYEDIATDISSAELKDVRAGADGTVYKSAGEAVRQQIGSLKESIKNATVTDGSITTSKIKDGAVTYDKLGIVKKQSDDSSETLQTNENLIQYDSSRDVCYVDLNNVPDKLYTIHAIRGGGYIKCAQLKYSADYYDSVAAYGNFTNAVKIEDISDLTNIYCCEIDLTAIKEKALSGSKIYPNNYVIVYYTTLNNPSANGYKLTKSSYDSDGLPYVCTKITKQSLTAYLQGKKYTFGIDDSDDSNDSDDLSDIDSNFVKLIKRINLATTITPDKTSTEYPHYGKKAILFGDSNLAYWNNTVTGGYPTKCFNAIGLSCKSYASPGATWYTSTGYVDDVTPNSSTMLGQFNTMKADYPTRNEDNVYLILSGTNDFRPGEISDSAGADGMVGAMKYTLEKIIEYDPTALIIGIIPPHRYDVQTSDETSIGKAYLTMEQKIPMIKQIYDSFSVPYINLYESSNIRIGDLKEDKIHLNVSGYSKLQRLIWATVNGH